MKDDTYIEMGFQFESEVIIKLFKDHLKFDPNDPRWIDRDRLIISNGHGSMLLYAVLYLTGYKDITLEDIKKMLSAGADRVCINSAAIDNINLLKQASRIFGSANITIIIQSIKLNKKYYISKSSGRDLIKINCTDWAQKVQDYGAGEIILTSVNNEGLKKGFDLELISKVSEKVNIPVIAHGGAGSFEDIYKVIKYTNISGVGLASILHYEALNYFTKLKPKVGNISFLKSFNK